MGLSKRIPFKVIKGLHDPLERKRGKFSRSVALVMCPCWGVQMPYLGLAYLSAYVKAMGATVYTLDLNIDVYRRVPGKARFLWETESVEEWTTASALNGLTSEVLCGEVEYCAQRILEVPAEIVGFSVYRSNRLFTVKVIKEVKQVEPSRVIVVGRRGCSTESERADFPTGLVDVFVVGEGTLASGVERNGDFSGIVA
jgi:hypothetical protein